MALTDESGTNMVLPVTTMGSNGNGFGGDFGSGWWLILLFLLIGNNGLEQDGEVGPMTWAKGLSQLQ